MVRVLHCWQSGMPVEEAIEHNVEGRLVPMDDPCTLAQEVLGLLATPLSVLDLVLRRESVFCFTINA